MLRRLLPLTGFAFLLGLATSPGLARAGALLPSGNATPLEQRVAIALGPTRATVWTSLRVDAAAGPLGIVVPVPAGAALDHSSDAWLEALDAATAPRVFPPTGASPYCAGDEPPTGTPDPFHVTADLGQTSSLAPISSTLLADAAAVSAWAIQNGLTLAPELAAALEGMPDKRFFAERFDAPGGPVVTETLRVVLPGQTPVLPLALTRAGASDLRVTAWLFGAGRGAVSGAAEITLPASGLHWSAANGDSNYVALRAKELAKAGASGVLFEAASHDSLLKSMPIAAGTSSVSSVIRAFFERASTYGDGSLNPSPCITAAGVALASDDPLAASCPRADLGVVDGAPSCVEAPAGAEVDPALLRCGGITDDLAVALSGLVPSTSWLTRASMLVPKGSAGIAWPVSFDGNFVVEDALVSASSIDLGMCMSAGPGSSTGASGSGSSGQGATGGVTVGAGPGAGGYEPVYEPDVGCACVGTADPGIVDDLGTGGTGGSGGSGGDAYVDDTTSDDCSGDTTDSSSDTSDDCSGDTTDSSSDTSDTSDDCSGDTTDSSDDTTSDDCSGDTTDSSTDTTSDDCSGDTSSDSSSDDCSGDTTDSSGDAEASRSPRPRASSASARVAMRASGAPRSGPRVEALRARKQGPKLSVLALGLLAILAPLRRLARPSRRSRARRDGAS